MPRVTFNVTPHEDELLNGARADLRVSEGEREERKRYVLTRGLPRRNEWGAYGDIYLTAALSRRPAAVYFEDAIPP